MFLTCFLIFLHFEPYVLNSMFLEIKRRVNVYCLQFFESGRSKVVCFTDMSSTILSEHGTNIGKNYYCLRKFN